MARRMREGRAVAGGVLVAAAVAVLAGCGGAANDDPSAALRPTDPGTPATPALVVAFADAVPAEAFTPVATANLDATPSLYVVADFTSLPTGQSALVTIMSPEGTAYLQQPVALSDGAVGLASVSQLQSGAVRLVFALPVWGSTIESYRRTGLWQASVSLQGSDLAGTAQLDLH